MQQKQAHEGFRSFRCILEVHCACATCESQWGKVRVLTHANPSGTVKQNNEIFIRILQETLNCTHLLPPNMILPYYYLTKEYLEVIFQAFYTGTWDLVRRWDTSLPLIVLEMCVGTVPH